MLLFIMGVGNRWSFKCYWTTTPSKPQYVQAVELLWVIIQHCWKGLGFHIFKEIRELKACCSRITCSFPQAFHASNVSFVMDQFNIAFSFFTGRCLWFGCLHSCQILLWSKRIWQSSLLSKKLQEPKSLFFVYVLQIPGELLLLPFCFWWLKQCD